LLLACAGRILAEDISAPGDLPPFDNSAMDGFAIRSANVRGAAPEAPVRLRIVSEIPAGVVSDIPVQLGEAARIMTGAPMPPGADAVVPVENTNFSPELSAGLPTTPEPDWVEVMQGEPAGANVRPKGMDVTAGQRLLGRGRKLQPQDVGMLATIGRDSVQAARRPRVALFSSGDELVAPGQPLSPGQIYDANQFTLASLLEREGADVLMLGTAPDDPNQVDALLQQAVDAGADLILTSAGVSVGAFDYVRQVMENRGSLEFWKVNMRPGKPLAFGLIDGVPLIGLPGNPVSAFIGSLVFVLPAIYRMSGRPDLYPNRQKAILVHPVESDGRESYLRALVAEENGRWTARLTGHQGSGNLFSLVQANALLIVPSGVKSLPSDSEVEIWFFTKD
jgi:molybdopterin molybdotransferase